MKDRPQTFTEAVEELRTAKNNFILALGEALGIIKILEWLERKL